MLPASPKPTHAEEPTHADTAICDVAPSPVIALEAQTSTPGAAGTTARAADGLVTVRPKPEKRKNARERAKEKYANKDTAEDGTTPDTTAKAKSKADKQADNKADRKAAAKAKRDEAKAKRAKQKRAAA